MWAIGTPVESIAGARLNNAWTVGQCALDPNNLLGDVKADLLPACY